MPVPVLAPFDFGLTELLNARLQNLGADPANLTAAHRGLMWIDGAGVIKFYDGDAVQTLGLATGGNAETLDGNDGAFYLNRANHQGTQLAASISDFAAAANAVIDGRAPALLDRANHTGVQPVSSINGFDEAVQDLLNGTIAVTGALTKNYDDAAGTLTLGVNVDGADAGTLDGLDSAAFEKVANKNVPNGYAGLDGGGLLPANLLPALAISTTHVVDTIAERDALAVQEGDVAVVLGTSESFIWDGDSWVELVSPTDGVQSVSGGTGITSTGGLNPTISVTAGGIGTASLADLAVTAAKLADGAVGLNTAKTSGTLPVNKGGTGATTAAAALAALGGTRKFAANVGGATEITVTHNLNTYDVQVEVFRNSGARENVIVDVERPTVNTVLLRFATAPAADAFRAVVVG